MGGVVMFAPGDVRVQDRPELSILQPTDAVIRLSATCICGPDLWPFRGAGRRRRGGALGRAVNGWPVSRRRGMIRGVGRSPDHTRAAGGRPS